ncbi:MAG: VWA-like domain-containing protein [Opitutaceae bacterium]|nr:VWA-like domain-containing protein [Opitutaceae bacterium]
MSFPPELLSSFQAARLWLNGRHPFYASLLGHMRIIVTADPRIETAAVDARDNLYVNPDFFLGLPNVQQRGFLFSHEVLHPGLGIFERSAGHDHELSNIAHDHVINNILTHDDPAWFIPGGLCDPQFAGMTYEDAYALLANKARQQKQPKGKGKRKGGKGQPASANTDGIDAGGMPGDVLDDKTAEEILREAGILTDESFDGRSEPAKKGVKTNAARWQARIAQAVATAQAMGQLSAGVQRVFDLSGTAHVDWTVRLFAALREAATLARNNYNVPARRSDALGFFAPREEFLGYDVTVYVDTSGSISPANLAAAIPEIDGIMSLCGWRVRWLEGDAKVLKDEWITATPEMVAGGGGTSFVPVFETLRDSPTKTLVVFTDTWGPFPDFIPDYPVIWAVYQRPGEDVTKREVPFGEIVPVPEADFVTKCA